MTQQQSPTAARSARRWAIGITVIVIALVVVMTWRATHRTASPQEVLDDAARACQEDFIPDRLKAPATAQFSAVTAVVDDAGSYRVTGAVDSQNSLGALVRSSFSCVMHESSGGDRWVLESAQVQE